MNRFALLHVVALTTMSLLFACTKKDEPLKEGTKLDAVIELASTKFPGGKTVSLTHGIGSGAFRYSGDDKGIIYTVSDRGPNIKCVDSEELTGSKLCEKGKIFQPLISLLQYTNTELQTKKLSFSKP